MGLKVDFRILVGVLGTACVPIGIAFAEGGLVASAPSPAVDEAALTQARDMVEAARKALRQARALVEAGRLEGDMLYVNCVLDKEHQIAALVEQGEQRIVDAQQAADPQTAQVSLAVVSVFAERAAGLLGKAAECVGKDSDDLAQGGSDQQQVIVPTVPSATTTAVPAGTASPPAAPPPRVGDTITDVDPSTDIPDMPTPASPTM